MAAGKPYIVFAVDSADRLTLLLPPKAGEAPETVGVLLSHINAPKVARRNAEGGWNPDEPCAFEAMDFVRSACIGKQVTFIDDFPVEPLQRMSGRLILPDGKTDLVRELLKKGYATVSDRLPPNMDRNLHEEYLHLQEMANRARVGVFAKDAKKKVRDMKPFPPENRDQLGTQLKGKTEKVRIERVQTGSVVIATILSTNQQVQVTFTGVQCPSIVKKDGSGNDPLGLEAKFFTERSLLHRHPPMRFDGVDRFGNFLGTIGSAKATYQEDLLSKGYGSYTEASGSFSEHRDKYRQLDAAAREKKLGVHSIQAEPAPPAHQVVTGGEDKETTGGFAAAARAGGAAPAGPRRDYNGVVDFEGTVIQIMSGDTVVVRNSGNAEHIRCALVGVKSAKPKRENEKGEHRTTYSDYAWEAREYLRTKYIGKEVTVHVEYGRHFEETKEVRPVATIRTLDGFVNIGAAVISQGFATFQLGRNDACTCADELLSAEEQAKQKQVGIHSGKPSPTTTINELNRLGASKGKYYLSFLQRGMQGNRPPVWKAVVDMVMAGSSFRVYIPREHFQLTLKLAGVITPSTGMGDEPADRFAQEAKDFAIQHLQQRDVEVQVETCDRGGNFIGSVLVGGRHFSTMIVEAGLATVAAADRLLYQTELQRAQKAAQDGHKYIWSSQGELPARHVKRNQMALLANPETLVPCTEDREPVYVSITDAITGTQIWLQPQTDEGAASFEAIGEAVSTLATAAPHPNPQRNETVAVLYRTDKSWLRAKINIIDKDDKECEVSYIDFGTREWVSFKDIRQIPKGEDAFKCVRDTAPLAFQAHLAYLKPMSENHEYIDAACASIFSFAEQEGLSAHPEFIDGSKRKYYVVTAPDGKTLHQAMLEAGVGLVDRRLEKVDADGFGKALEAQAVAKKHHKQMWQFGDAEDDDDDV